MFKYYKADTESRKIIVELDTGGEIEFFVDDKLFAYYGPGLDIEANHSADALKDIFFKIEDQIYTALQIAQHLSLNGEDWLAEAEQDEQDEIASI